MSLVLLFRYLLLNMFRMLVHPSSRACHLLWIYFMCCIALVRCVLVLRCGSAGVVWYRYAGFSLHNDTMVYLCSTIVSLVFISSFCGGPLIHLRTLFSKHFQSTLFLLWETNFRTHTTHKKNRLSIPNSNLPLISS